MKKTLMIFIASIVLIALTGCDTLRSPYSGESQAQTVPSADSLSRDALSEENENIPFAFTRYEGTSFIATNTDFFKDAHVIVWFNNTDFKIRGIMETALVDAFKKRGIDAVSFSKIFFDSEPEDEFDFWEKIYELKGDYVLAVTVNDIYRYSKGGGISDMDCITDIYDAFSIVKIGKISSTVMSNANGYESYAETLPWVCEVMADRIAEEYVSACLDYQETMAEQQSL